MVSDVVFQCENFLAHVEKINRIMGVKEYFYRWFMFLFLLISFIHHFMHMQNIPLLLMEK